jgi:hypothetical protein
VAATHTVTTALTVLTLGSSCFPTPSNFNSLAKATSGKRIAILPSSGFSRATLRTRNMSALLETTSLPGVYSLAETGIHLHSEIESCERLAHKVAVITVGSAGMGFATAKRFVRKGVDQRVHTGPAKGPWIWRSLRSARRQRESRAMSPAKVIWTAFTNRSKHMVEKSTWSSRNAGITQLAPFGMRVLTRRLLRSIRGGPYEHR